MRVSQHMKTDRRTLCKRSHAGRFVFPMRVLFLPFLCFFFDFSLLDRAVCVAMVVVVVVVVVVMVVSESSLGAAVTDEVAPVRVGTRNCHSITADEALQRRSSGSRWRSRRICSTRGTLPTPSKQTSQKRQYILCFAHFNGLNVFPFFRPIFFGFREAHANDSAL